MAPPGGYLRLWNALSFYQVDKLICYFVYRINNTHTDWFDEMCGLRQGCILSPVLFSLHINDLALYLKSFDSGIRCDDDNICICISLYVDDIVLFAETAQDLQVLLNALFGRL